MSAISEMLEPAQQAVCGNSLRRIAHNFSIEVVALDETSVAKSAALLPTGTEVFVAGLPKEDKSRQISAAIQLHEMGHTPVPHIVARNIESRQVLEDLVQGFTSKAFVERALILAGDRDKSRGPYADSLDLLDTGVF